jgi:hypothetical protein
MAAVLLSALPTAVLAQDAGNDPSTWVTTVDNWISAGTADAHLTVTDVWLSQRDAQGHPHRDRAGGRGS